MQQENGSYGMFWGLGSVVKAFLTSETEFVLFLAVLENLSCIPDTDIHVLYLDRQFLSHPCYLTLDRIKITCI